MFFSEDFIASVEENPISGIVDACNKILDRLEELSLSPEWSELEHELLWESASFIRLVIQSNELDINVVFPQATGDIKHNCSKLLEYVNLVKANFEAHSVRLKIESYTSRYSAALKSSFAYEFSQGDLDRIQTIVNELRAQIAANKSLQDDHKRRLLKRLEHLQSELHKRVSDLDRFWGLVGDAGIVLGKLGNDAKPIVDRIKEVAEIVWKTQARSEELPSDSQNPMLEHEDDMSL
ncbi:MAG: hypothetical protein KKE76_01020 [Gammaproteobacteria bacterium]|nr:hypothetical protein [Gammaproteobacteria bacterium]